MRTPTHEQHSALLRTLSVVAWLRWPSRGAAAHRVRHFQHRRCGSRSDERARLKCSSSAAERARRRLAAPAHDLSHCESTGLKGEAAHASGSQRRAEESGQCSAQSRAGRGAAQRAAMWVCGSETLWRLPSDGGRKSRALGLCEWVWRKTRRNGIECQSARKLYGRNTAVPTWLCRPRDRRPASKGYVEPPRPPPPWILTQVTI